MKKLDHRMFLTSSVVRVNNELRECLQKSIFRMITEIACHHDSITTRKSSTEEKESSTFTRKSDTNRQHIYAT